MKELGSLLDHSEAHKEAEEYISKALNQIDQLFDEIPTQLRVAKLKLK